MTKRVLLLTGTTDRLRQANETDNTMEEVFDMTLPSKQRYVKRHGYDLLSLRSFATDKNNRFSDDEVGYLRMLRSFEMLEYYDIVMWIDADSIITNDQFSVNDFYIDNDHSFYASWDWTGKRTFSTGNFIIQNTKNTNRLYEEFLKVSKYVQNNNLWGWEQTTMNIIYNTTALREDIKILDHKFLGSIPSKELFRGIWDGRPDPPHPWTKDSFLCHITGVPNMNRIDVLNNSFNEYI